MSSTTVYLVRHAEQATGGDGLSALGATQAALVGRRLAGIPFTGFHHSPLPRAAETAAIIAGTLTAGAGPHPCELAADRTPVPSPGRRSRYPTRYLPWLDAVPAGERDEDAAALTDAVDRLTRVGDGDRHELVVTHRFVAAWFVRHVLGAPEWRWLVIEQANTGLNIVRYEPGRPPLLVCANDTGHL
ncbi:histidine phosphatase family protein [Dactylosporangium sp. CS-047395]|uniref:histidine phosphatase family protein n=1 Tax=Dactylosporangium sp. CS-047395 TaxID=3239936 RepID=UPI003D8DFCAA